MSSVLHLTKHHGLGNDFLVLLEPPPDLDAAELARRICDRRRGVGADGLTVGRPGIDGADITMELRNADGSRAEMSGNGIRCFAQAVWDAGLGPVGAELAVATDAGVRVVRRVDAPRPGYIRASVDMGPVKVLEDAPEWVQGSVQEAALVDAGNPHLVLLDARTDEVAAGVRGPEIESGFPGGMNVEWIWPGPGPDELTLRVWERGAGETEACGTGSCAAVAAAVSWSRVGPRVVVHNPGGDVTVELGETAVLTGPAARIAAVELPWP
ncbi:MAG TPA: diaminopimelate epimerase [Acidimicrobiales bacterium]